MPVDRKSGPMDDQGGVRERLARHGVLPLRLFLGATFLYAGLDTFFSGGPFSHVDRDTLHSMLGAGRDSSAAPRLVDLVLENSGAALTLVAVVEIAVGALVLLGLLTRPAALVGAGLALGLWLTVSWGTNPYYFGNDLPYAVGFLTLALTGAGAFSLDAARATRRAAER
ncbi:DoxX family protein [Streptomyces bohaiensis]|uniref:DoxX family protein n=1 Tax=Streptomyces bohaiensis TaxID=1431344 RepID=A0ABX1CG40_9ACTN|nr:DoxX family protein [Streptomyces bohaiensis]NJQ18006.1 DoxX family protein [Streptomyces bohaiensis]